MISSNQLLLTVIVALLLQCHGDSNGQNLRQKAADEVERDTKYDLAHGRIEMNLETDRCTSVSVGPKAGVDGPMATHTSDCADCDFRVNKVPARDWPEGSLRPLYLYRDQYPVIVSSERGATWQPSNLQGNEVQLDAWGKESPVTAYIPQVPHTFALYEGGYGIMNEHQVAIGESTCAARFFGTPVTAGGKAKIEVAEMSRIALERSRTAREAIQIMGDLATELGFYAADWSGGDRSLGEGGEGLSVVDKNEAWIFHVLADDTGASAVWAAQRVPDDHVAVIANSFVIRQIDPDDSKNFMFSKNIFEVAERNGLWNRASGKKLDFLATYAPMRSHPEYSTRRVWRVFNIVAPSVILPGETDAYANDYPFSVKVDKPLTVEDVMNINRDHFEGTPYDETKGLVAGPYGDPHRYDGALRDNMTIAQLLDGGFERGIALFRTSYSFVANPRAGVPDELALLWYGQYDPTSCAYAPFYVNAEHVPTAYTRGSLGQGYDSNIAYWNFLAVGNYAARMYHYAMEEVKGTIDSIHAQMVADVAQNEREVLALMAALPDSAKNPNGPVDPNVVQKLTDFTNAKGEYIQTQFRALFPKLITTYHDGMIATHLGDPMIQMKKMFYPKWWLEAVGYFNHPGHFGPGTILFASNPDAEQPAEAVDATGVSYGALLVTALLSSVATYFVTVYAYNNIKARQHEYTAIPTNTF